MRDKPSPPPSPILSTVRLSFDHPSLPRKSLVDGGVRSDVSLCQMRGRLPLSAPSLPSLSLSVVSSCAAISSDPVNAHSASREGNEGNSYRVKGANFWALGKGNRPCDEIFTPTLLDLPLVRPLYGFRLGCASNESCMVALEL